MPVPSRTSDLSPRIRKRIRLPSASTSALNLRGAHEGTREFAGTDPVAENWVSPVARSSAVGHVTLGNSLDGQAFKEVRGSS